MRAHIREGSDVTMVQEVQSIHTARNEGAFIQMVGVKCRIAKKGG